MTVVPSPGADSMASVPATRVTRRRIPASPYRPAGDGVSVAKPAPSSATSRSSTSSR
ncbi:hypothetical protein [Frankia canadensis]|uniref:hypothetical protein n=1 Tax=Frankia canadensis TaxID=1836972 RepID=UPI001403EDDC|nr:hypothetical protein [Frankia canadensis]